MIAYISLYQRLKIIVYVRITIYKKARIHVLGIFSLIFIHVSIFQGLLRNAPIDP